jgi:hypothetical protein
MPPATSLLAEATPEAWFLGKDKTRKHGVLRALLQKGVVGAGEVELQLVKADEATITVPFEPSMGEEGRTDITFNVPDAVADAMIKAEERVRDLLRPIVSDVDSCWRSKVRPAGAYEANIRCKISLTGPRAVHILDANGQRTTAPEHWAGQIVVPLLATAVHHDVSSCSLVLEVAAVVLLGRKERPARDYTFVGLNTTKRQRV